MNTAPIELIFTDSVPKKPINVIDELKFQIYYESSVLFTPIVWFSVLVITYIYVTLTLL